jgi:hypothetical protein
VVHQRFPRADFPESLQVGLVTYTDWGKCQTFSPFVHNSNVLDPPLPPGVTDPSPGIPFDPDLVSSFEYLRFHRPTIPPELAGRDLWNPSEVADQELLSFLGENAIEPGPVAVGRASLTALRLSLGATPNPFSGQARISFRLPRAAGARLAIHDLSGRRVRELVSANLSAGEHVAWWDGRDASGVAAAPGVYLAAVTAGGERATTRIARLR